MTAYRPSRISPSATLHPRLHADTGERPDGWYAVIGCKKNNANEVCNSCASLVVAAIIFSYIACFILLVNFCDRLLMRADPRFFRGKREECSGAEWVRSIQYSRVCNIEV